MMPGIQETNGDSLMHDSYTETIIHFVSDVLITLNDNP